LVLLFQTSELLVLNLSSEIVYSDCVAQFVQENS
jgi:hypothetical protein